MYIDDLFHSPVGRIAAFAEMQLHLYRHDVSLQDYFEALQSDTQMSPRAQSRELRAANPFITWAIRGVDKVGQFHPRRKIKADVLVCPTPYFDRKTENQFLIRALLGLAQTDAKIVCLLPSGAVFRNELDVKLAAAGRSGQITFLDPVAPLNSIEARSLWRVARMRGRSAFGETVEILEPHGLNPGREVEAGFERLAYFVEAWERLAPWVEFDAVVARCNWPALCSPVCRTGHERGKRVIIFQQGVIATTLDVPVTASKYVAFGPTSAFLMAQVNRRFFKAAGMPEPPVEYVNGGSLYDTVISLPNQFDHQTLLMVDVQVDPGDFHGVRSQNQALLQLAERLLAANLSLRRLVIRPHPFWNKLDFEGFQNLVRKHLNRCELSHPAWSLEDDLRRSSIVVGILSGVLTVASACGLPTIFLQTKDGFTTGDLACFSPQQTLQPDAAFCEIGKILTDRQAYAEARMQSLRNAREYYANGKNLELSGAFFERLLRTQSVASMPERNLN